MINDGRWQAMTPHERAGIQQQAAQAHMEPEAVGKMAARANVKTVVLTHLRTGQYPRITRRLAEEVKKHFSGQVLSRERPDGVLSVASARKRNKR